MMFDFPKIERTTIKDYCWQVGYSNRNCYWFPYKTLPEAVIGWFKRLFKIL